MRERSRLAGDKERSAGTEVGAQSTEYITLNEAAALCPPSPDIRAVGIKRHPASVWRWCRRGILTRDGHRLRLKHVRLGGRYFTTARHLQEFLRRAKVH
jgi:hypothetical protein